MIFITATLRAAVMDVSSLGLAVNPVTGLTMPFQSHGLRMVFFSTSGPITEINFAGVDSQGRPRGIFGRMSHRWTSSQNDGEYDLQTPGFYNTLNTDLDTQYFDSHFVAAQPEQLLIDIAPTEGNVGIPDPFGHPFPSTPSVGWGWGGSLFTSHEGALTTRYRIPTDLQSSIWPVAWIMPGGNIRYRCEIVTTGGAFELDALYGFPFVPEPSAVPIFLLWALSHRRRNPKL